MARPRSPFRKTWTAAIDDDGSSTQTIGWLICFKEDGRVDVMKQEILRKKMTHMHRKQTQTTAKQQLHILSLTHRYSQYRVGGGERVFQAKRDGSRHVTDAHQPFFVAPHFRFLRCAVCTNPLSSLPVFCIVESMFCFVVC